MSEKPASPKDSEQAARIVERAMTLLTAYGENLDHPGKGGSAQWRVFQVLLVTPNPKVARLQILVSASTTGTAEPQTLFDVGLPTGEGSDVNILHHWVRGVWEDLFIAGDT